jgi:hypothetical protein
MRKNLFLYLALACFVGLIAIFIADGYMGIYDNLFVTTGEREEEIGRDSRPWQESVRVEWGGKAFFRYEVDNRQFSSYTADIEVSIWRSQEKIRDLVSQQISVAAFDKGQLEWVMDTTELLPGDIPPEQSYQYTVIIKRGEIERKIIVYINPIPYPPKPVPLPPR